MQKIHLADGERLLLVIRPPAGEKDGAIPPEGLAMIRRQGSRLVEMGVSVRQIAPKALVTSESRSRMTADALFDAIDREQLRPGCTLIAHPMLHDMHRMGEERLAKLAEAVGLLDIPSIHEALACRTGDRICETSGIRNRLRRGAQVLGIWTTAILLSDSPITIACSHAGWEIEPTIALGLARATHLINTVDQLPDPPFLMDHGDIALVFFDKKGNVSRVERLPAS